ncbi:MAG: hypothetical protein WAK17_10510 [Candidatus Nitrosopolaris sp.]|jgi:hypothetical protein
MIRQQYSLAASASSPTSSLWCKGFSTTACNSEGCGGYYTCANPNQPPHSTEHFATVTGNRSLNRQWKKQ